MSFWSSLSKDNKYLNAFIDSLIDIGWSFFPVFLVFFVLSISGTPYQIAYRSDLYLLDAILFAESWKKFRDSKNADSRETQATELFGLVGLSLSSVLAACVVLSEAKSMTVEYTRLIHSDHFQYAGFYVFAFAVLYAFACRISIKLSIKEKS